jgi:TRAP-type mannitol/chloroaromatic compound transport system substrate-binding protein
MNHRILVALVLALGVAGCQKKAEQAAAGQAPAVEAVRWKMMSLWGAGTLPQKLNEKFAERVKVMSGGRLLIEALPGGSIVAPTESLDAVMSGVLDAQQGGTGYWPGKDAAFSLLGDLQGGWEHPYQAQEWMEYGGGKELVRELYAKYNVHFVTGIWYGNETLVSKRPIRTLADFKGLKKRAPVGMGQDIYSRLGAAPVNLPGSEVYTALERGVVDASDWGTLSMNQDLGYHKLARYPTYPGFHSMPMGDVAVNAKRWNALPDDLKEIVEVAARDFSREMVELNGLEDIRVANEAPGLGFEPISLSPEERRKFREIAREVWKEYASRSPMAKRVYDSQTAFLKKLGLLD